MKIFVAGSSPLIVLHALAGVASAPALAQEVTQSQGQGLTEVMWDKDGTYQWNRPDHVRWALVRACGGGGGGGGGYSLAPRRTFEREAGTSVGGGGGAGALLTTTLV